MGGGSLPSIQMLRKGKRYAFNGMRDPWLGKGSARVSIRERTGGAEVASSVPYRDEMPSREVTLAWERVGATELRAGR